LPKDTALSYKGEKAMSNFIPLHLKDTQTEIAVNFDKVFVIVAFKEKNVSFTRILYDVILRSGKRNVNEIYIEVSETVSQIQKLLKESYSFVDVTYGEDTLSE